MKSKISAYFDRLLEESDIDDILNGEKHSFDERVVQVVNTEAQKFIDNLFGKLRERMIDLRTGTTVFVGGGSVLLRKQIEGTNKIGDAIFVNDISANAKGYELLYKASKSGR